MISGEYRALSQFERRAARFRSYLLGRTALCGALTLGLAGTVAPRGAHAGPAGSVVVGGAADISRSGAHTEITQHTQTAIINHSSFDIGRNESVNFAQPNAASLAVNRVVGADLPTSIAGKLTANGNVWVLNPSGVAVQGTAQINVGGVIATTAGISDEAIMAGQRSFSGAPDGSAITNAGSIRAGEGSVVLVAPVVSNSGTISARGSDVALGAGSGFTVDFDGDGLTRFEVTPGRGVSAVNTGTISAQGGAAYISAASAQAVQTAVVSIGGKVEATRIEERGGVIVISGGDNGVTSVTGELHAAQGAGRGGRVIVTGDAVAIGSKAVIDASGASDGGMVEIGGAFQGGAIASDVVARPNAPETSPLPTARRTTVAAGARIAANAGASGDGGKAIVWSDGHTAVAGRIEARGGAQAGDGGLVETSGKTVKLTGSVDASAPNGAAGSWLIDPVNISIGAGLDVEAPTIIAALTGGNNVKITTGVAPLDDGQALGVAIPAVLGELGNITVTDGLGAIAMGAAAATLTLEALNDIRVEAGSGGIVQTGPAGALNLVMDAGNDIVLDAAVTLRGSAALTADADYSAIGGLASDNAGTIEFGATGSLTAGDITLRAGETLSLGKLTGTSLAVTAGPSADILDNADAAISVTGAASFSAGDEIDVDRTDTHRLGSASLSAARIESFATVGDITYGDITATDGANVQNRITSGSGNVVLSGDVSIAGTSDLTVGVAGSTATLDQAGGTITVDVLTLQPGSTVAPTVTLNGANDINRLATELNAVGALSLTDVDGLDLGAIRTGTLTLVTGGPLTDSGTLAVTGAAILRTSGDAVTLDGAANNFGGAVRVDTTNGGSPAAAVTLADTNALTLSAISAASLTVTAEGAIRDTNAGVINVTGATTMTARDGANFFDIRLDNGLHAFSNTSAASFTGEDMQVATSGATRFGAIEASSDGTADGTIAAATGSVVLDAAGAITLAGDVSVAGTLGITADGTIGQAAGTSVLAAGATSLASGGSAITLGSATNDFGGAVAADAGAAAVTVADLDAITLGAITAGALEVSAADVVIPSALTVGSGVTFNNASGQTLTLGAEVANRFSLGDAELGRINAASLTVNSADQAVTLDGIDSLAMPLTVDAGTAAISYVRATSGLGDVTLRGGALTRTGGGSNLGTLEATGAMTVDVSGTAMFGATSAGSLTVSAGDVDIPGGGNAGSLTVTDGVVFTNRSGGTVGLGATAGDFTLSNGELGRIAAQSVTVDSQGKNVTLDAVSNLTEDLTITAGSATVSYDGTSANLGDLTIAAGRLAALGGGASLRLGTNKATVAVSGDAQISGLRAGELDLTVGDDVTFSGASTVTGAVGIDAGTNALEMFAASIGADADGITDVVLAGGASLSAQSLDLVTDNNAIRLGSAAALPGTTTASSGGGAISVLGVSGTDLVLDAGTGAATFQDGATTLSGDLTVNGGAVGQNATGTVTVAGATSITATGNVALGAANDFSTVGVSAAGRAVALTDTGAVALDAITAASLALAAGGNVTQASGLIAVPGATSITSGGNVTLTRVGNDFADDGNGAGDAVDIAAAAIQIRDANSIQLGAVSGTGAKVTARDAGIATTLDVGTGTAEIVSTATGAVVLGADGADTQFDLNDTDLSRVTAGTLTVDSGSKAVGLVTVDTLGSGVVLSVDAGTATVSYAGANTGFGGLTVDAGSFASDDAASSLDVGAGRIEVEAGPVQLANATAGTLSIASADAVEFAGTSAISGDASVTAADAVRFVGATSISGTASISSGDAVSFENGSTSGFGDLSVAATSITDNATGTVTVTGLADLTSDRAIDLGNLGNDFGTVDAVADADAAGNDGAIRLRDADGITLGTVSGNSLTVTAGDLNVTTGVSVSGAAQLSSTAAGDVLLGDHVALASDFHLTDAEIGRIDAGAGLTIDSANSDIRLQNVTRLDEALTVAAGTGTVGYAGTNSGFGDVEITAGAIAGSGSLDLGVNTLSATVAGDAVLSTLAAGELSLTVGQDAAFTGTSAIAGDATVTSARAISVFAPRAADAVTQVEIDPLGSLDVGGELTFSTGSTITLNSGTLDAATTVLDGNGITVDGVTGQDLVVGSGTGALVFGGASVFDDLTVTGAASITQGSGSLSADTADFTSAGDITLGLANDFDTASFTTAAGDVTLKETDGFALGGSTVRGALDLTVSGALSQVDGSALAVTDAASIDAGSAAVTLAAAGNDFGGTVTLNGGAMRLRDENALALGTVSGGSLELSADDLALLDTVTLTGALTVNSTASAGALVLGAAAGGGFTLDGTELNLISAQSVSIDAAAGQDIVLDSVTTLGEDLSLAGTAALSVLGANAGLGNLSFTGAAVTADAASLLVLAAGKALTLDVSGDAALAGVSAGSLSLTVGDDVRLIGANSFAGVATIDAGSDAIQIATNAQNGGATQVTFEPGADLTASTLTYTTSGAITANAHTLTSATTRLQGGAVTVTGLQSSGADAIGNDLAIAATGAVRFTTTGSRIDGLTVESSTSVGQNAGGTLGVAGDASFESSGDIILGAANDFSTSSVGATGDDVVLNDVDAIGLDAISARSLTVTAGGAITQSSGTVSVTGNTTLDAGAQAISLTAANDFGGAVSVTGGTVGLVDINAIELGDVDAASFDLSATDIEIGGTVDVSGLMAFTNGSAGVANLGASAGGQFSLDDVELGRIQAGSVSVSSTGGVALTSVQTLGEDLALSAGAGAVTYAGQSTGLGNLTIGAGSLAFLGDASLELGANTAAISVTGDASLRNLTAGDLSLSLGDDLLVSGTNSILAGGGGAGSGAATVDGGGNALTVFGTRVDGLGSQVEFESGAVLTAQTLTYRTTGGVNTGAGTLTSATTRLQGDGVTVSGLRSQTGGGANDLEIAGGTGAVAFRDLDSVLDGLTVESAAQITQNGSGGLTVTGDAGLTAAGDISLGADDNDFARGGALTIAAGGDVTVDEKNGFDFGDVSVSGNLSVGVGGDLGQSAGTIRVGQNTAIDAGTHAIALGSANDFADEASAFTTRLTGGTVAVADLDSIRLGSVTAAQLDLTATDLALAGPVAVAGTASFVNGAGDGMAVGVADGAVDVDGSTFELSDGDLAAIAAGVVELSTAGTGSSSIDVHSAGLTESLTLDAGRGAVGFVTGGSSVGGDLLIVAGRAVTQEAAAGVTVSGSTGLTAGDALDGFADIRLDSASNDFVGTVSAKGGDIALTDRNGIALGVVDANANTDPTLVSNNGSLSVRATGNIADTAGDRIDVQGATSLLASGGEITLDNGLHDFDSDGGNTATDAVNASAESVRLHDVSGIRLGDVDVTGALTVRAEGDITDSDTAVTGNGVNVAGVTSLSAGGDILLDDIVNDFADVGSGGRVDASGGDIRLGDASSVVLGAVLAGGDLAVQANGGNIVDSSRGVVVAGSTSLSASGNVTLDDVVNDFNSDGTGAGQVDIAGVTVTLADANDIRLGQIDATGNLTVTATGTVRDSGATVPGEGVDVRGTSRLQAGGDILLSGIANDFDSDGSGDRVDATATEIRLTDANSIVLGTVDAGGALTVRARGGSIADSGHGISVTGVTSLSATGDVTLDDEINDFDTGGLGRRIDAAGANVALSDQNSLVLGDIDTPSNLTVAARAGSITDNGATGAGGDIDVGGLSGLTATTEIRLDDAFHDFGSVDATAPTVVLNDRNGVQLGSLATGALSVSAGGAITDSDTGAINVTGTTSLLAAGGGAFFDVVLDGSASGTDRPHNFGGLFSASGATVSVVDADAIRLGNVTARASGVSVGNIGILAGGDITQQSGTALTAPGDGDIRSVGGAIALTQGANDLADELSGRMVALNAAGAVSVVDADSIALGASSGSRLSLSATDVSAAGDIMFAGTVALANASGGGMVFGRSGNDGKAAAFDLTDAEVARLKAAEISLSTAAGDIAVEGAVLDTETLTLNAGTGSIGFTTAKTTVAGRLSATAGGSITQTAAGAVDVAGHTTLAAGGTIDLGAAANNFDSDAGPLADARDEIDASGTSVSLRDVDAVALGTVTTVSLAVDAGGSITDTDGKGITVAGATSLTALRGGDAFDIRLDGTDGGLTDRPHDFSATSTFSARGEDVVVVEKDAIRFGTVETGDAAGGTADLTVAAGNDGDLSVTALGDITQAGAMVVRGDAAFTAPDHVLLGASNDFRKIVDAAAATVLLTDRSAIALGTVRADRLTVTAGGTITDTAGRQVRVTGDTSLAASNGPASFHDIRLDSLDHDFAATGGAFSAVAEDLSVRDVNAINFGAVELHSDGAGDGAVAGSTGRLAVRAGGDLTQTGIISAPGETSLVTPGDVAFGLQNRFGSSVGAEAREILLSDADGIRLGRIRAGQTLTVSAGGAITDTNGRSVEVSGDTRLTAMRSTGGRADFYDIRLDNADLAAGEVHDLGTRVDATGEDIHLTTRGPLLLGAVSPHADAAPDRTIDDGNNGDLSVRAGGTVTQQVALAVPGDLDLTAQAFGSGDVFDVLLSGDNRIGGVISAVAEDVSIRNTGGRTTLGAIVTHDNSGATVDTTIDAGNRGGLTVVSTAGSIVDLPGHAILVSGATALAARAGTNFFDIALDNADVHDFAGAVGATGEDIVLDDRNAIVLGAISAHESGQDAGTADADATVAFFDGNGDGRSDAADGVGARGDLTVRAGGAITETGAGISVDGRTRLEARSGAGTFDITLNGGAHDFDANAGALDAAHEVDVDAATVVLTDNSALALGRVSASGSLSVTAAGSITDTAGKAVTVRGATALAARAGTNFFDIALDNADVHDFAGAVGATGEDIVLDDRNAIVLGAISAHESGQDAGTADADATVAFFDGNGDGRSDAADGVGARGDLTVRAGGAITETGAGISVDGRTRLEARSGAGTFDITLNGGAHDFDANAGALDAAHEVDVDGATVVLTDNSALALGRVSASGSLSVTAAGSITDTAGKAVTVRGATALAARAGTNFFDIALDNADVHDFAGAVGATGEDIVLDDRNAIVLGAISAHESGQDAGTADADATVAFFDGNGDGRSDAADGVGARGDLTVRAGGAITETGAGISVDGRTRLEARSGAGTFDITLNGGAHDFDANAGALDAAHEVDVDGATVVLTDNSALALGRVSASGSLSVTAAGSITDTAGKAVTVSGATALAARAGTNFFDIALDNADVHDFAGAVGATGEDIVLDDRNAIVLGAISAHESGQDAGTADADATVAFFDGNGDGRSDAADGVGARGDLTVRAGGAITETGAGISVDGRTRLEARSGAGTFDITLNGGAHDFDANAGALDAAHEVDVDGASVALADRSALKLGRVSASGDLSVTARGSATDTDGEGIVVNGRTSVLAVGTGGEDFFDIAFDNADVHDFNIVDLEGEGVVVTDIGGLAVASVRAHTDGAADATVADTGHGGGSIALAVNTGDFLFAPSQFDASGNAMPLHADGDISLKAPSGSFAVLPDAGHPEVRRRRLQDGLSLRSAAGDIVLEFAHGFVVADEVGKGPFTLDAAAGTSRMVLGNGGGIEFFGVGTEDFLAQAQGPGFNPLFVPADIGDAEIFSVTGNFALAAAHPTTVRIQNTSIIPNEGDGTTVTGTTFLSGQYAGLSMFGTFSGADRTIAAIQGFQDAGGFVISNDNTVNGCVVLLPSSCQPIGSLTLSLDFPDGLLLGVKFMDPAEDLDDPFTNRGDEEEWE